MPVGGFVVTVRENMIEEAAGAIDAISCAEVHGHDDNGNIVMVLDCRTSDEMEKTVQDVYGIEGVLSVGLTYLNAEDEVEKMERGEYIPSRSFGNRHYHGEPS